MSQNCRNIILTGFMGAGKSSVGHILARAQGCRFVDVDEVIVASRGQSIKEIFASEGEEAFRDHETAALLSLKHLSAAVIATGGGAILRLENRRLLEEMGVVVYLRASFGTLMKRLVQSSERPLADISQGTNRLRALFESRKNLYEQADIVADTDSLDAHEVARVILQTLERKTEID